MDQQSTKALERLIAVAQRDTGQSKKVANFLLAWWNATDNGGFDLTDMWGIDRELAADMVTVFTFVSQRSAYPDALGYGTQFEGIWGKWRKPVENRGMIRFIYLGEQLEDELLRVSAQSLGLGIPRKFCFFNTVNDHFLDIDGVQVWSNFQDFSRDWEFMDHSFKRAYPIERFMALVPEGWPR